ncbi:MAG: nitrile hydratase accessory protein [Candidatus Binatia bacterium]
MSETRKRGLEDLSGTAAIPRKNGELVFDAPWQSRAFGMAVGLHEQGYFTWEEFRDRLIAEIGADPSADAAGGRATLYYRQWLHALEDLLHEKGLLSRDELEKRIAGLREG